jgi:hypothetical protein
MVVLALAVIGAVITGCGSSDSASADNAQAEAAQLAAAAAAAKTEAREASRQRQWEAAAEEAKAKAKREKERLARLAAEEEADREAELATAKAKAKKAKPVNTEGEVCSRWPGPEQSACEITYAECAVDAGPIVEGYYEETGPDMMEVAEERADHFYSHSGWASREAAFTGCYAAFSDKYDKLYR